MMFLVRSAFWLSIVYAHMPLDGGQVIRGADEAPGAVVAGATALVKSKCAQDAASCRAILKAAAGALLAPVNERSPGAQPRTHGAETAKGARPSSNSLSADDLAAPWRGRQAKSGA
jgi:hypothetical protein